MPEVEIWLHALAALGLALGFGSIWLIAPRQGKTRNSLGRYLFIGTLLLLGGSSLLAALLHADGLIMLGLSSGGLVTGLLWETPGLPLS